MGGLFADPVKMLPGWFGAGSIFELEWIKQNPYALPGLINAIVLIFSFVVVFLFLEEVSSDSDLSCIC